MLSMMLCQIMPNKVASFAASAVLLRLILLREFWNAAFRQLATQLRAQKPKHSIAQLVGASLQAESNLSDAPRWGAVSTIRLQPDGRRGL